MIKASQLSHKQLVLTLQCLQAVQLNEEAISIYEEAQQSSARSSNLGEVALLEYMKAAMSLNCNLNVGQVLDTYRMALLDSANYPQLAVNSKAVYYAFKLCGCLGMEGVERAMAIRQLLQEKDLSLHYSNLALLIALSTSQDRYDICQQLYEEYQSLQERRGFSLIIEVQMLAAAQHFLDQDTCLIIIQVLFSRALQGQIIDQRTLATMLSACIYLGMWDSGCQLIEENIHRFPTFEAILFAKLTKFVSEYENLHNSPVSISSVQTVLEAEEDQQPRLSGERKLGSPSTTAASRGSAGSVNGRIEQLKLILQERQQSVDSSN